MRHCVRRLGIIACLVVPSRAGAQLVPVGVPRGIVRLELDGSLETFDRRFRAGHREPYAADLSSPALGSDRIPSLADADARIGRVIQNPGYRINLGALSADAHAQRGTGFLGLSLGLTKMITVFGRIPLVQSRVQSRLQLDPASADAGLNPGAIEQATFFGEFDAALTTLSNKLSAGDYGPAEAALAQATLADGTALRGDLFGLLADPATASVFVPTTASSTGGAIAARIAALQNTLAATLDVPGFTARPALPDSPVSQTDLMQYLTGPLALRLDDLTTTFRGDVEVGATMTLVDRWDRGARRGGLRAAISGLVRFPTGRRDRTEHPLDLGTSEGNTDVQLDVVTDIGAGNLGARLTGSYVRRLSSDIPVRVTAPNQPLVGPERLSFVRRDPGDVLSLGVKPFYRLARTLALQAGIEQWSRKADGFSYATPADVIPGVDAGVLGEESSANATVLSVGITVANPGRLRPGGSGLPVDASWSYERVLRAGGGRVPDAHTVRGQFRVYFGLW